jgi:hypothetical protein
LVAVAAPLARGNGLKNKMEAATSPVKKKWWEFMPPKKIRRVNSKFAQLKFAQRGGSCNFRPVRLGLVSAVHMPAII